MKYQPPFDPSFSGPVDGIYNADADASYRNGDPATGAEGDIPPFESVEHPMRELVHLISNAGLTPTHEDLTQVRAAVEEIIKRSVVSAGAGDHPLVGYNQSTKEFFVKSLTAGANITITPVEDPVASGKFRLVIASTGGAGEGSASLLNVGDGAGEVYKGFNDPDEELRTLKGINGIVTRNNGDVIEIDGAALGGSAYQNKVAYPYIGADYTWTVPTGVTAVLVKCWAAGGAGPGNTGGPGGYTWAELPVTPGDVYKIVVGRGGRYTNYFERTGLALADYSFGGRGYLSGAGDSTNETGNGGGLTGFFLANVSQAAARAVAGGGGGFADNFPSVYTQGGSGNDAVNAGGESGMNGANGDAASQGGGGSGYNGGHAGSTNGQTRSGGTNKAGEGGTGFIHASKTAGQILATAEFDHVPPATTDTDYEPGVGIGGNVAVTGGFYDGGHGLLVLRY